MKLTEKYNDYLKGQMSETANDTFTKEIVKDYFDKENYQKKWGKILAEKHNITATEGSDTKSTSDTNKGRRINLTRIIAISISIAASVLVIAYVFFPTAQTNEMLAIDAILSEQYNKPVTRGTNAGTSAIDVKRNLAYENYGQRDYANTIPALKEIIDSNEGTEEDHFYLGLSYYYNKQAANSVDHFKYILSLENAERKDAASWFLALAHIEAKQCQEAIPILTTISTWSGNKGKQKKASDAKRLIQSIEKGECANR